MSFANRGQANKADESRLVHQVSDALVRVQAFKASKRAPGNATAAPLQAKASGRSRNQNTDSGNAKSGYVPSNVLAMETSSRLMENKASQKPPKVTTTAATANRPNNPARLSGSNQPLIS